MQIINKSSLVLTRTGLKKQDFSIYFIIFYNYFIYLYIFYKVKYHFIYFFDFIY